MLATLLQAIEQALGPSLSLASDIAFWVGAVMVAYLIVVPLLRVAVEFQAAGLGMGREWIMQCLACRRVTVVTGPECEHCGKPLDIPWTVRVHNFFGKEGEARWLRMTRWVLTVIGVSLFFLITVAVLISSGAWRPETNVERLFTGLSLIAWAGLGWLLGRVLGIGTGGPISRIRDAIFVLATIALLSMTTTLAAAARPIPETVIASVRVDGQVAQVGTKAIPLVGYQLGFEYLQVDHELLGFHRVTPLAIVGALRVDLPLEKVESTLVDHLWQHTQTYTAHGLSVRRRTEQFLAAEPGTYEIVLRGHEVSVRHYIAPPT